jgi:hypothetical protein
MKKTFAGVVILMAGACIVHAQGISFANYLATYVSVVSYGPTSTPLGGDNTGPAPTMSNYASEVGNGLDWTVQLWGAAGDNATVLAPLPLQGGGTGATVTSTFADGVSDSLSGTWYSSEVGTVSGATGASQPITLQLYAWYNDGGTITSYATALADLVPVGTSAVANSTTGSSPSSPSALPDALGNFSVSVPVPEPGTLVLGGMGAAGLLLRRRRS